MKDTLACEKAVEGLYCRIQTGKIFKANKLIS
jgi:hypothetical protein